MYGETYGLFIYMASILGYRSVGFYIRPVVTL